MIDGKDGGIDQQPMITRFLKFHIKSVQFRGTYWILSLFFCPYGVESGSLIYRSYWVSFPLTHYMLCVKWILLVWPGSLFTHKGGSVLSPQKLTNAMIHETGCRLNDDLCSMWQLIDDVDKPILTGK